MYGGKSNVCCIHTRCSMLLCKDNITQAICTFWHLVRAEAPSVGFESSTVHSVRHYGGIPLSTSTVPCQSWCCQWLHVHLRALQVDDRYHCLHPSQLTAVTARLLSRISRTFGTDCPKPRQDYRNTQSAPRNPINEKLMLVKLVMKFLAFTGAEASSRARHCTVSCSSWVQSATPLTVSIKPIDITFPSTPQRFIPCLPNKILNTFLSASMNATFAAHLYFIWSF
jgi:hypothetical protein